MSVSPIRWHLPGCGDDCRPQRHDPYAHEAHGLLLALRTPPATVVRTGGLVVDLDAVGTVRVDGRAVGLTDREWHLLAYLARHLGRFCPADDIIAAVWGPEWVSGDVYVCRDGIARRTDRRLVNVNANRLRAKLGTAGALITAGTSVRNPGRCLQNVEPASS